MKLLLICLLLVFPLGQLDRFNLSQSEVVFHLNDFVVFIVFLIGLIIKRKTIILEIKNNSLSKPIIFWIGTMFFSLIVNWPHLTQRQLLVSSLYSLRWIFYAGLFFIFAKLSKENKSNLKKWLIAAALAVTISGLIQYILLPDVSFLKAYDWDDHYFRLVSTFLDPGFTGAILVLGLIITYLSKSRSFIRIAILSLLYAGMALTYSRASYLMYLVSFAGISIYQKSLRVLLIASLILVLTIFILPQHQGEGSKLTRENSIVSRINNWKESLSIWSQSPLFGVGFNSYRYRQGASLKSHSGAGADSSIFLIMATTGLIGLIAYLNLGRAVWIRNKKNPLVVISFLGVLIHSFFNNTLFYPWIMEWLWLLLATNENI